MNQNAFDSYLLHVRALAERGDETAFGELQKVIEQQCQGALPPFAPFFSGEQAFYRGDYEVALKYYLKAAGIPLFQFFCFRASAFLFHSLGYIDKAVGFAEKALKIEAEDPMTLRLLRTLVPITSAVSTTAPSLKQTELRVLQHIFEPSHEELFAEEFKWIHQDKYTEPPVNTESDIFSSPHVRDVSTAHSLTERLYPEQQEAYPSKRTPQEALQELHRLAQNTPDSAQQVSPEEILDNKIKGFQYHQTEKMRRYQKTAEERRLSQDFELYYLHGWSAQDERHLGSYLTEQSRKPSGGIFLRWNGKGIALNPGPSFLEHFHAQGLTLNEIDFVIVTAEHPDAYADVKEIYDLNYQLNKANQDHHLIRYYFHVKAFQELSRTLKPHFKQERNHLHSLEIFMDSPDVEKIELTDGISLHYFLAGSKGTQGDTGQVRPVASLGIRLDCKTASNQFPEKLSLKLGYIAHSSWNPLLAPHLGSCDLLLVGLGNTHTTDYNKLAYNPDSLGYYGTLTLLEEVIPRLLLCGEFGGREGDIRLETVQKLRYDFATSHPRTGKNAPVVVPADIGLKVCLKTLQIQCSVSKGWIEPSFIKAIKTADSFASLKYISPWSYC